MYTRHYVEAKGRFSAGLLGQTDDWYLANVMGKYPIYCRKNDKSVTPSLINEGFWEAWITSWFLNELEFGKYDHFIDVGANCGYYSVIGSTFVPTIAIEPNPQYSKLLRANKNLHPRLTVNMCAVSDKTEIVTLRIPGDLEGSASIAAMDFSAYDVTESRVHAYPLDDIVQDENVYGKLLIKIDAEGAEQKVWHGMQETLKFNPTVMLEYTPNAYDDKFVDELEAYGDLTWINYAGVEEPVSRQWLAQQTDWVMLVLRKR